MEDVVDALFKKFRRFLFFIIFLFLTRWSLMWLVDYSKTELFELKTVLHPVGFEATRSMERGLRFKSRVCQMRCSVANGWLPL